MKKNTFLYLSIIFGAVVLSSIFFDNSSAAVFRSGTVDVSSTYTFASTTTPPDCVNDSSSQKSCSDPAISCTANNCDLIQEYIVPGINLFSAAFGLVAIISIILGGINYTTSEGDPQKVSRAKVRIRNTIFAILSYLFLYAFLNFLIPGGVFQ